MRPTFAHACLVGGMLLGIALSSHAQLGVALNATNLTWTTSGTLGAFGWSVTTFFSHDGVSAASSGSVSSSQTTTLQTTVTGPGTLTFWWRNPSFDNSLTFNVGGTNVTAIILYPSWQQQTIYIGSGTQTLKWIFSRTSSPGDSNSGYVDEVTYTPGTTAPVITAEPTGQSQCPGFKATFAVSAGGTPPLSYQWQFNGTNIPGATASSYTVTNVQFTNLGYYRVVVTNGVDSTVSSNAPLEFGEITAWGASGAGAVTVATGATNILAIAGASYFNLALRTDGALLGWGNNANGQISIPPNLTGIVAIAAGGQHSLALKSDGTVAAWGDNFSGLTNVPPGLTNVVAIAAGSSHNLALKSDGTVAAWGSSGSATNVPVGLSNVVAIAAGGYSLALNASGIVAWSSGPAVPVNLTNVVAIAAGASHGLALMGDRTVVGWGANNYGQATVPIGLTNVIAINAGAAGSLALLANGTVVGWGYNVHGQTNIPSGLTNVVAISAGDFHNLALVGTSPPVLNTSMSNPAWSTNGFSLSLPSQSGRVYALEYKDALADSNWTALPLVAGNGTNLVLTDSTATNSQRLYRVRRW